MFDFRQFIMTPRTEFGGCNTNIEGYITPECYGAIGTTMGEL